MIRELTSTALACPAMIRRIRLAMRLAALGKGHEMGGHDNRAYVPNRHGHNVIRVDWRQGQFVFYGRGCNPINDRVKAAFQRAQVGPRPAGVIRLQNVRLSFPSLRPRATRP